MRFLFIVVTLALLGGCATSQKVQPLKANDYDLSCKELTEELAKLDDVQSRVDQNKGVNGTNVASAIFWIPGLAYTMNDASEATRLVNQRRDNLEHYYEMKKCRK